MISFAQSVFLLHLVIMFDVLLSQWNSKYKNNKIAITIQRTIYGTVSRAGEELVINYKNCVRQGLFRSLNTK